MSQAGAAGRKNDDDAFLLLLFLIFLLAFFGFITLITTPNVPFSGGTGDLTIEVEDQNGDTVSGEVVQVLDPKTGQVIAESSTGANGDVEFTLDQGEYDVVVDDVTQEVNLGGETDTTISVDRSPPEPLKGTM